MRQLLFSLAIVVLCLSLLSTSYPTSVASNTSAAQDYKTAVVSDVEAMAKQTQVMVDSVFSFGELGFQEIETSKYLTGILEKEGFKIQRGISGMPTAWVA